MKDIQSQHDPRHIDIRKVGIKELLYPVTVLGQNQRAQRTVARIDMSVRLSHHCRGTHMSRFVEILNRFHNQLSLASCLAMLEEIKARLTAEAAYLEIAFPYFFSSATTGAAACQCRLTGSLEHSPQLCLELEMPVPASDRSAVQGPPGCLPEARVLARLALPMECSFALDETLVLVGQTASARESRTVEALCQRVGAALRDTGLFPWLSVTAKAAQGGYQICAFMEWAAPQFQAQQSGLRSCNFVQKTFQDHHERTSF